MATATKTTYTKEQQKAILTETEAQIAKVISAQLKKYPGVQLPWQVSVIVPSAPLTVEHTSITRPLAAKDASVPAPES